MYGIAEVQRGSRVIDTNDRPVEIGGITIGSDGMAVLLDASGNPIKSKGDESPRLVDIDGNPIVFKMPVVTILSHGQWYFLDQMGRAIMVGVGQAGEVNRHVLMLNNAVQNNRLVYYLTHVNNVYTFFLTGQKNGRIIPPPTRFPSSAAELSALKTYGGMHGKERFSR
jgi:hypothetical protein